MQDSTQLLQQYGDGDEGADGDDGGGDDDDPDEVQLDGGVDGDDLPSPRRNSPGMLLKEFKFIRDDEDACICKKLSGSAETYF